MRKLWSQSWRIFREKRASFLLGGALLLLSSLFIWLYYQPTTFLYHNEFVPHFAAVFFEVALAILVIEEIFKSKQNLEKKKEKRRFFMSKMKDKSIDTKLLELLQAIEQSVQLLDKYRKQNNLEKYKIDELRLKLFEKHCPNFDRTKEVKVLLLEKKSQDPKIQKIINVKSNFRKNFAQLMAEWDIKLMHIIESISLTSYPHDTKYNSWDYIVSLQKQIQNLSRSDDFPPVHTDEERLLQKNNMFLAAYILTLKSYAMVLMDYEYDFHVHGLSQVHNIEFVNKLYECMKK